MRPGWGSNRSSATANVTLYCTWRPSVLHTGPHKQVSLIHQITPQMEWLPIINPHYSICSATHVWCTAKAKPRLLISKVLTHKCILNGYRPLLSCQKNQFQVHLETYPWTEDVADHTAETVPHSRTDKLTVLHRRFTMVNTTCQFQVPELQCQQHGELVIHNEHFSNAESFVLRWNFF